MIIKSNNFINQREFDYLNTKIKDYGIAFRGNSADYYWDSGYRTPRINWINEELLKLGYAFSTLGKSLEGTVTPIHNPKRMQVNYGKDWITIYNPTDGMEQSIRSIVKWKPEKDETYYSPYILDKESEAKFVRTAWYDNNIDRARLERGLVFKTEEEATEIANKMIEFLKNLKKNK